MSISLVSAFVVCFAVVFGIASGMGSNAYAVAPVQDDAKRTQSYINLRDYKSLVASQTKLLSAQKKSHASPFELMPTLLTLGNAQLGIKNFTAARSTFEQGAKLAAQAKDKEQLSNFSRQLGTIALRQSKFKQANANFQTASNLHEKDGKSTSPLGSAKDHYCQGRLLEKQQKWLEAKDQYDISITCFETANGRNCSEIMVPIWCLYMCAKGRRESVEDKLCWAKLKQLREVHKDFLMLPVEQEREFFDLWYRVPVTSSLR